jgi:hypothetical protein
MFAGCAYRQRTGACTCDNPPIGCVRDAPPPHRPAGLSFPSDITSYADLRAASSALQVPARPMPPPREVVPRGPQPLPLSAGHLPALGLLVDTASDTGLSRGVAGVLCYVEVENLAGTCADQVACVVNSASDLTKLSRAPTAVLLRCTDAWEAEWTALHAAAAPPMLAGLTVPNVTFAADALRRLTATGAQRPALLAVPLCPTSPASYRALVGLCRRTGIRLLALHPLGDSALRAHPAVVAAGAQRPGGVAEALIAWSVGKGAIPMVHGDDVQSAVAALIEKGYVTDLESGDRAALDSLAS